MMIDRRVFVALASAVAARVDVIVPVGFKVELLDCGAMIGAPDEVEGRSIDLSLLLDWDDNVDRALEIGALRILDDVQDEVIESIREAWPKDDAHAAPASAFADWSGSELVLGYRYGDHAVVAFEPVSRAELGR